MANKNIFNIRILSFSSSYLLTYTFQLSLLMSFNVFDNAGNEITKITKVEKKITQETRKTLQEGKSGLKSATFTFETQTHTTSNTSQSSRKQTSKTTEPVSQVEAYSTEKARKDTGKSILFSGSDDNCVKTHSFFPPCTAH